MKRKGFTIIELLISISIIGILSTIVILEYGSVQARARDAQRIKDLDKIRYGLIAYRQDNGSYPSNSCYTNVTDCLGELKADRYLESIPSDPRITTTTPGYYYDATAKKITTGLEDMSNYPSSADQSCRPLYCLKFEF